MLCQRHLDTLLGEAGDRTNNLQVTSQPALLLELLPPYFAMRIPAGCGLNDSAVF